MKKLVTAFAACALAGLVNAQVESVNVVGYYTIQTEANKMNTVAFQFDAVGTEGAPVNIQDIKVGPGFAKDGGDWIKFWDLNTSKYTFAMYFDEVYADVEDENPIPGFEGWADGNQTKLDITLEAGQGFWVQTQGASSLILAGQIAGPAATNVTTVANKMDLVCNPYPVTMDIQDIKVGPGFAKDGGDWIKFWDPTTSKYTFAMYFDEVYADVEDENPIPGFEGWADGNQTKLTRAIYPGEAFWVQSQANSSLFFDYPL